MELFFKMLFPKLWFSIDGDLNSGGGAPNGQPEPVEGNDPDPSGEPVNQPPTDFIEVKGVKIPASEFEALAKEKYKDRFEAYENREKWQAENTRKAQEIKQYQRDAESFRRLQSDPRFQQAFQPRPQNTREAQKQSFIQKRTQAFPDVDPRFFEAQFEDMWELSGMRAKEMITPYAERNGVEWEKNFLREHPMVKPGTEKYDELAQAFEQFPNADPEKVYRAVYHESILAQQVEDRIKARDEEAKRKLKAQSPTGSRGQRPKTSDEAFESAWAKYGD